MCILLRAELSVLWRPADRRQHVAHILHPHPQGFLMLLRSFLSLLELSLTKFAFPNQLICLQQWEFLFVSNAILYL